MHSYSFFILVDFKIPHNNKLNPYSLKLDNVLIFSILHNMLLFQHKLLGTLLII